MAQSRRWIITASGDRPINEVEKKLIEAGFSVDQVLDAIGCIIGTADDNLAKKVRAIPGVADVSPDDSIDIGKPDSPVTW